MTHNEALDWCEQFTDNLVMVNVDTKKRTLGLQAMRTCKSALEKQIPKKPLPAIEQEYDSNYGICPNCKRTIFTWENFRYCSGCGQALDWGDTE